MKFVVLVADGQFTDAGDWADEWGAVGLVCPGEHLGGSPAGVPWLTFPYESDSTRAADAVVRSLAPPR